MLFLFQNINGGCTALCVLHRPTERQLYAAWVGDSQAIVISQNKILRLVNPHKPERVVSLSNLAYN